MKQIENFIMKYQANSQCLNLHFSRALTSSLVSVTLFWTDCLTDKLLLAKWMAGYWVLTYIPFWISRHFYFRVCVDGQQLDAVQSLSSSRSCVIPQKCKTSPWTEWTPEANCTQRLRRWVRTRSVFVSLFRQNKQLPFCTLLLLLLWSSCSSDT